MGNKKEKEECTGASDGKSNVITPPNARGLSASLVPKRNVNFPIELTLAILRARVAVVRLVYLSITQF